MPISVDTDCLPILDPGGYLNGKGFLSCGKPRTMARSAGSPDLQPLTVAVATGNSDRERATAKNFLAGTRTGSARGIVPSLQTSGTGTV